MCGVGREYPERQTVFGLDVRRAWEGNINGFLCDTIPIDSLICFVVYHCYFNVIIEIMVSL